MRTGAGRSVLKAESVLHLCNWCKSGALIYFPLIWASRCKTSH